jgi:hypothetical protein
VEKILFFLLSVVVSHAMNGALYPAKLHNDNLIKIDVSNGGCNALKIGYAHSFFKEPIQHFVIMMRPGYAIQIALRKDIPLTCQMQIPCPEGCEQTGEHSHWGDKVNVPFEEGQSIELGAMVKSAAKE